ncbi:MAG: RluA family pseudouridine synthase [Verrucomicrobiota bacterium]
MTPPLSRHFVVAAEEARQRLDLFLASKVPTLSRSRLQSLIKQGAVLHNNLPPRARDQVRTGDHVSLEEPALTKSELLPEIIALSVLYEDQDLLVLDKAAGISVHPGAGRTSGTLVNALLAHCRDLSGIGGTERPGIVHRLDKETSGCLVVAKNDVAHRHLARQFADRTVEKIYLALIAGKPKLSAGIIETGIARHRVHRQRMTVDQRGRAARTDYRVRQSGPEASLVECRLHSGRTHQIRVHLQHLGHPVLGDRVYAGRRAGDYPRQMLHAWKLGFDHPRTEARVQCEAPLPLDFASALESMLR